MHAFGNFFERETSAPQCQRLFDGIAHRITSSSVNSMTGRLFSWWVLFSIMVCSLVNARATVLHLPHRYRDAHHSETEALAYSRDHGLRTSLPEQLREGPLKGGDRRVRAGRLGVERKPSLAERMPA